MIFHHQPTLRALLLTALLIGSPVIAQGDETSGGEGKHADPAPEAPQQAANSGDPNEPPAEAQLFDRLLVIGSAEAAARAPGSAHFLGPEDLERQAYSDVHRILRQVPGVNIQEEDGYGLRPNIGIRGTGVDRSQKVTLLEDGVLIAPAPYAAPAAYYTPTAGRMESFEVRKGSGAIRQGPYTNGGALNYVSTSIPGSLHGRIDLSAGDERLRRARASLGDSGPRLGWLLETYQLETDGFKRLDGGGPAGFDLEDYLGKLRWTSRAEARVSQAVELKLGKTEQLGDETYLGLTQDDFDRDPLRRYASSAGDHIATDHEQFQLSYFVQPSERFSLTATLYRNDFFRNWHKLEKVAGTATAAVLADPGEFPDLAAILRGEEDSDPGALAVRNNRRDYFSRGIQAVLAWDLGSDDRPHDLEVGIRLHEDQEDRFQEDDLYQMLAGRRVFDELGAPGSNANRIADAEAVALFIQDTFSRGNWTLTPGVRVERIDLMRRDFGQADPRRTGASLEARANDLTEVIPGFGAEYRLDDSNRLFAGVHRGFSPPSPSSSQQVDAEESINYEIGWRHRAGDLTAEVIGFYNDYDNLLGNDTLSTGGRGTGDQFNGGAVEVTGIEAGLGLSLPAGSAVSLPFRLTYTFTEGEFRSSFATGFSDWAPRVQRGDELPYIPRHQLHAGVSVLGDRWAIHLDTSYSDRMRTRAGSGPIPREESIDARFLVDLKVEYDLSSRFNGRFKVWGQLLNATDEVYVASRRPAGLRPGRPRAALFGVSLDFPG
jgi:Fe(3+) dicitrate transport protein